MMKLFAFTTFFCAVAILSLLSGDVRWWVQKKFYSCTVVAKSPVYHRLSLDGRLRIITTPAKQAWLCRGGTIFWR